MSERRLTYVVYHEDDGFVAQCLEVNVASDGDTEEEAVAALQEALELYFEDSDEADMQSIDHARVATLTLPRSA